MSARLDDAMIVRNIRGQATSPVLMTSSQLEVPLKRGLSLQCQGLTDLADVPVL